VQWRIRQGQPTSYRQVAEEINTAAIDVVSLQHEFGLYGTWGDPYDDHLTGFLEVLRKPLVTTLHSVLPDPSPSVRASIERLGQRSQKIVVMAERARSLLVDDYGISTTRVTVIPHGVPPIKPHGRTLMKEQLGVAGRVILTTFGLVDPRKGLEFMIEAMQTVGRHYPDALYLILGKTHPDLVRREGEAYRKRLWRQVEELDLEGKVAFVDDYLSQPQIVDYLLASDVYVTPYLDPLQITSGTLAYALGAGKAIISTPYLHAAEVLAGERGLLVDFRSADGLAELSLRILDDPDLKRRLEHNAYAYGRATAWPRIGERMLAVLRDAANAIRRHSFDAWSLEPVVLRQADAPAPPPPVERVKATSA
jgi:glycosyltransferase involved in cell wall biosynthesis